MVGMLSGHVRSAAGAGRPGRAACAGAARVGGPAARPGGGDVRLGRPPACRPVRARTDRELRFGRKPDRSPCDRAGRSGRLQGRAAGRSGRPQVRGGSAAPEPASPVYPAGRRATPGRPGRFPPARDARGFVIAVPVPGDRVQRRGSRSSGAVPADDHQRGPDHGPGRGTGHGARSEPAVPARARRDHPAGHRSDCAEHRIRRAEPARVADGRAHRSDQIHGVAGPGLRAW